VHSRRGFHVSTAVRSCQGEPCINLPTKRKANHPAPPSVENSCQINEASGDAVIGDVSDPELIGSGRAEAKGKVGEDRTLVVAIRGAHELMQQSHVKAILAHRACRRLVMDDQALGLKLTSETRVAVAWEPGSERFNEFAFSHFLRRHAAAAAIVSRTRSLMIGIPVRRRRLRAAHEGVSSFVKVSQMHPF
jgi:hypothetical protein